MTIPEPLWGFLAAVVVGLSGGITGLYRGTHLRIAAVEKRIETLELEVNREFLSKEDFRLAVDRIEQHMVRIENKLDNMR